MAREPLLLDDDIDFAALGALLAKARRDAGFRQKEAGEKLRLSEHSMSRTETGARSPVRGEVRAMLELYAKANPETLLAIRSAARLDPPPAPAAAAPVAPSDPPAPPPAPAVDGRAEMDALVRACAEDLDVSARRLRSVLALLFADVERLGLTLPAARDLVAHSPPRRA